MQLEEALLEQEQQVDALIKSAKKYTSALSAWKKSCQTGNVITLQKSSVLASELVKTLSEPVSDASSAWTFDLRTYLESGAWRDELVAACVVSGHRVIVEGDTLVSPPLIIRAQPGSGRLLLGKAAWPTLHPVPTAAYLKALSEKSAPTSAMQQFLNFLYEAAKRLTPHGNNYATFKDIYELYSYAPGWAKENSKAAFAQQIYLLDRSEVRATKDSKSFHLDGPTGTHKPADLFSVIADDGNPVPYYGVWFD